VGGEKKSSIKQTVFNLLEDPRSSRAAMIVSIVMNTVIIYSVILIIVESYPAVDSVSVFYIVSDAIIATTFALEYALRLLSAPDRLKWFFKPLNLIDLFSTLPFFIYLVAPVFFQGKAFFIFRVLRLVRLLKLGEFNDTFQIAATAFQKSTSTLVFIAYLLSLFVVFFASAMYYAEQMGATFKDGIWYRQDGTKSPFQNIPETFWWCITTLTTVGYGDAVPVTWAGKLVATAAMVTGLLFVAAPVAIFGANFNEGFQAEMRKKEKEQTRDADFVDVSADEVLVNSDPKSQILESLREGQKALKQQITELKNNLEAVENTFKEQEESLLKLKNLLE